MQDLSIVVYGANETADKLNYPKEPAISGILRVLASKVLANVIPHVPVRTGYLARHIVVKQKNPLRFDIMEEGVSYGRVQRLGTVKKNYMIFPKTKKALYWVGLSHPIPFVGEPITRRHPGIKPHPYNRQGLADSQSAIQEARVEIGKSFTLRGIVPPKA